MRDQQRQIYYITVVAMTLCGRYQCVSNGTTPHTAEFESSGTLPYAEENRLLYDCPVFYTRLTSRHWLRQLSKSLRRKSVCSCKGEIVSYARLVSYTRVNSAQDGQQQQSLELGHLQFQRRH